MLGIGVLEHPWRNSLWVATVTTWSVLPRSVIGDQERSLPLRQNIKEKACITEVSAVVSAAEEALLLCWTQCNCTEMYTVWSDSAIKCESTVSVHDF